MSLGTRTRRTLLLWLGALWAAQGADESFRFAVVGDRTGETVPGVYEQVWREIGKGGFAFAINVGDTIQGFHLASAQREWRTAREIWSSSRIPFYLTPGNHDIWSDAARSMYEREAGRPAWYSFDYRSAHFTVLDNSAGWQLSDAQMEFLERDLKAHAGAPLKLVFFHQPFWLLPLKLGSTDFPFHALMRKYGVTYVFCGHIHQLSRMERDKVNYVSVGSSGGHLRGHDPATGFGQGWFYQYVAVTVTAPGRAEVEVRELGPPSGKGRHFPLQDWSESGGLRRKE